MVASRLGTFFAICIGAAIASASAVAETVFIEASRDATLIEDAEGRVANGSGPVLFVGRTNQREGSVRRSLIHFDVASALPAGARVVGVRLTLVMTPSNRSPRSIELHRALGDWSEGPSSASGGGGDDAQPGDATWIHSTYDDELWVRPGGHFVARSSGALIVADPSLYSWESTRRMVADVRLWLRAPHRNFGWILIGDEASPQNVKGFASRESSDPDQRPLLEVSYELPGS